MCSLEEIGKLVYPSTKEILLSQLDDFEKLCKELFESIAKGYAQRGAANDLGNIDTVTDKVVAKHDQIEASVARAIKQVDKEEQIKDMKINLQKIELEIMQLQNNLKEAENILATALHQARNKLNATEEAKRASVSCEELIKFAFRISTGNSVEAPPDWVPGDPRRPYPLDIEMRFGKLGQLSQKLIHNGSVGQINNDASSDAMNVEKDKNSTTDSNGGSALITRTESLTVKNGGAIWQGPPTEDVAHLATMPVSAMMTNHQPINTTSLNGNRNLEEVEFMSSSSDSSSSGESG